MQPSDRPRDLVLFVHGFNSSPECWQDLLKLLREDERVSSRYDFEVWSYPTKLLELNPLSRIPPLKEIGRSLGNELDSAHFRDRRLTLVGHSQGGLVILSHMAQALDGSAVSLRNIRQAIFFATPCAGSTTVTGLRRFLSSIFSNPQERALRVLDPDVKEIVQLVSDRIVNAAEDSKLTCRIPIHALCGMEDDIVPEASARGVFQNVKSVRGTHFSIIKPADRTDPRYTEFVEILLEPGGHRKRFEVQSYDVELRVEPCSRDSITAPNGRVVEYDNYAEMKRTVRFAPNNRCTDRFRLQYGSDSGYVEGHESHENEADARDRGRCDASRAEYRFAFTPTTGEEYWLKVDVRNGFPAGARNVHFHFRREAFYHRMAFTLDLSAYVAAGWTVSEGPGLFVAERDVQCGKLCHHPAADRLRQPVSHTPEGVYRWELSDLDEGVVAIRWDVSSAASGAAAIGFTGIVDERSNTPTA